MKIPNIIDYDPPIKLSFLRSWKEYEDVYSFTFKSEKKLPFLSGQNARIVIPELSEEEGKRSLSFASTPSDEVVLFSTHTKSGSKYKRALLALEEGDIVHLVKIKGETTLLERVSVPVVFIAGGVGVTPFRSMLFDIQNLGRETKTTLIHVCNGEYLYQKELEKLDCDQHRIRRPEVESTIQEITKHFPYARYYISGSEAFLESLGGMLKTNEISKNNIITTSFFGYEELLD